MREGKVGGAVELDGLGSAAEAKSWCSWRSVSLLDL